MTIQLKINYNNHLHPLCDEYIFNDLKWMKNINALMIKLREIVFKNELTNLEIFINNKKYFLSDLNLFSGSQEKFQNNYFIVRAKLITKLNILNQHLDSDDFYKLIEVSKIAKENKVTSKEIIKWLNKFEILILDIDNLYVTNKEFKDILAVISMGVITNFDFNNQKVIEYKINKINITIEKYLKYIVTKENETVNRVNTIETNFNKFKNHSNLYEQYEYNDILKLIKNYSINQFNAIYMYLWAEKERTKLENRIFSPPKMTKIRQITGDYENNSVYPVRQ